MITGKVKQDVMNLFDTLSPFGQRFQHNNVHQNPTALDYAICVKITNTAEKKHLIGALGSRIRRKGEVILPLDVCHHIYDIYSKVSQPSYPISPLKAGIDIYHLDNKYKMIKGDTSIPPEYTIFSDSEYKFMVLCHLSALDGAKVVAMVEHGSTTYTRHTRIGASVIMRYEQCKAEINIQCPYIGSTTDIPFGCHMFAVDRAVLLPIDGAQIYEIAKDNTFHIDINCIDLYRADVTIYIHYGITLDIHVWRPNSNQPLTFVYGLCKQKEIDYKPAIEAIVTTILEPLLLFRPRTK